MKRIRVVMRLCKKRDRGRGYTVTEIVVRLSYDKDVNFDTLMRRSAPIEHFPFPVISDHQAALPAGMECAYLPGEVP